ncbi:DUF3899 domain-containing protein [Fictibacillus iocasae]|uniref:DUF3899 domain-containing protein n=1 Tax=Fictibacillus iocasae TaxID=2715437 RepID=A0ABW2NMD2_9BACL
MSNIASRSLLIASILALGSFLFSFFFYQEISLLHYINTLFMASLFAAMAGLVLYILKGGLFDLFVYSFKKMVRLLTRNPKFHEMTIESAFSLSENVNTAYMKPLLYSGIGIAILTTMVAFLL